MQELLRNAWQGWRQYISDGKLAVLLLAVLLWYWFGRNREQEKQGALYRYTTLMAVCCICPVTAALLQVYQTRFYDYRWIWFLVPMTLLIGYGCTTFLAKYWEQWKYKKQERGMTLVLTGMCAGILVLCGGLGGGTALEGAGAGTETEKLLETLLAKQEGNVCLWAPREVMSRVRALNGSIRLIYGRNMWDEALGGYSYDTCSEEEIALYEWMCLLEDEARTEGELQENAAENAYLAREKGVNTILLPGRVEEGVLQQMEAALGAEAEPLDDYYLLCW